MEKICQDCKILIIEDDSLLSELLQAKLQAEKFNVIVARDGDEGLQMALKNKPDIILLDLIMPNMDGLAMLKELRKNEWGRGVIVIILSNLNDVSKISELTSKDNVTSYLIKTNWQLSEVVEKIKEKLQITPNN